jgi:hypothetical protein
MVAPRLESGGHCLAGELARAAACVGPEKIIATWRIRLLTFRTLLLHIAAFPAHRGAPSGGGPEGGAGSGVPGPWPAPRAREALETARRALRPVLPGAGCTCSAGNGGAGNADPRPKIATEWSAERRGVPIARDAGAPRKRPARERYSRAPVPRKHRAPVGAPPPLNGWDKLQDPGADASRERERLSDIVREDGVTGLRSGETKRSQGRAVSAPATRTASSFVSCGMVAGWPNGRTKPTDENAGITMRVTGEPACE